MHFQRFDWLCVHWITAIIPPPTGNAPFFDKRPSWKDHVNSIIAKAGRCIGMLGRIHLHITSHSASVIYTSLIIPVLEYSCLTTARDQLSRGVNANLH